LYHLANIFHLDERDLFYTSLNYHQSLYSFSGLIPRSPACHKHVVCAAGRLLRLIDARLSAKKTADAQNAKSAGMTAGGLRMKQALACNNIQVIPECFNRESRKTD
jgi:hypothetical protein